MRETQTHALRVSMFHVLHVKYTPLFPGRVTLLPSGIHKCKGNVSVSVLRTITIYRKTKSSKQQNCAYHMYRCDPHACTSTRHISRHHQQAVLFFCKSDAKIKCMSVHFLHTSSPRTSRKNNSILVQSNLRAKMTIFLVVEHQKTYLDVTGRPVIVLHKENVVHGDHSRPVNVS